MGELLARVARPEALAEAWDAVYARDAADEVVSAGVRRFAVDAQRRISEIAAEVTAGEYQPDTLTEVEIPKDDGDVRVLHVPSVRDRVVERAVLAVLTPVVEQAHSRPRLPR
jgi:CRISP-associated protein Cas1